LKVDEISSIVLQEITPQLERLRKEKSILVRFRTTETEATILWKQLVAADFLQTEMKFDSLQKQSDSFKQQGS
jgi:chromosome segregation ATPase